MATYYFKPHEHVRIWLSNDENSFLGLENQLRLREMRQTNPRDTIHFVYDKTLLNTKALTELDFFCRENNLIAHDINDLFDTITRAEEIRLIDLYKEEVTNLHDQGNLAAASNILRWMSCVFRLGIYSDCDIKRINTRNLPRTIAVESPILIPLGSVKLSDNDEYIMPTMDCISVVDEEGALPYLQRIWDLLYKVYRPGSVENPEDISLLKKMVPSHYSAGYAKLKEDKSPRELRSALMKLTDNELRELFQEELQSDSDEELEHLKNYILTESVVYSSGPSTLVFLNKEIEVTH